MGYLSLTKLSLAIQEQLNKLHAGNLSVEELEGLKANAAELYERITILQYKAEEQRVLNQADKIINTPEEVKHEEVQVQEPIKIQISNSFSLPKVEPVVVETIPSPVIEAPAAVVETKAEEPIVQEEKKEETVVENTTPPKVELPKTETPTGKVSLVERMQKTKVSDLKTAIGLNQKFLFMNFLFEGENNSYNDAIEKLNAMPTIADARHYVRELAYLYNWNFEDENVVLFTEYIERRYI